MTDNESGDDERDGLDDDRDGLTSGSGGRHFHLQAPKYSCACENGSVETTVAEGSQNPVLWGHTLGGNWPPEPTSSYASIDFWCQLVASPATVASWMSVIEMVGYAYQAGLACRLNNVIKTKRHDVRSHVKSIYLWSEPRLYASHCHPCINM